MKKIIFNNLKYCKNLKEMSDCFSFDILQKNSFSFLVCWFICPIFLFFINLLFDSFVTKSIWLTILFLLSFISLLNFIFSIYKISLKKIKFIMLCLVLYIMWAFLSCCFSNNIILSLFGSLYRQEGFFVYLCYVILFFSSIILNDEQKKKIFKIFSIVTFVMSSIVLIGYYLKIDFNFYRTFTSIFFNENHSAYYFMMGYVCTILLFLFNKEKKYIIYLIMSFVILHNLVLNNTLGCYVAVFVTLVVLLIYCFIIKKNLKKIIIIIITFVCVSLVGSDLVKVNLKQLFADVLNIKNNIEVIANESNDKNVIKAKKDLYRTGTNRLGLWLYGLEFVGEKPIFGYGIENLLDRYSKTDFTHVTDRPHNEYIQIGAFMGIPALIFYFVFLNCIFFPIILNIKKIDKYIIISAFIALSYLVSAFFGVSMFYTTPYLFIFLGFTASYYIKENEN